MRIHRGVDVDISIHAPRVRGDRADIAAEMAGEGISIHAPRVRGDCGATKLHDK